jgi:hypothetical protein
MSIQDDAVSASRSRRSEAETFSSSMLHPWSILDGRTQYRSSLASYSHQPLAAAVNLRPVAQVGSGPHASR